MYQIQPIFFFCNITWKQFWGFATPVAWATVESHPYHVSSTSYKTDDFSGFSQFVFGPRYVWPSPYSVLFPSSLPFWLLHSVILLPPSSYGLLTPEPENIARDGGQGSKLCLAQFQDEDLHITWKNFFFYLSTQRGLSCSASTVTKSAQINILTKFIQLRAGFLFRLCVFRGRKRFQLGLCFSAGTRAHTTPPRRGCFTDVLRYLPPV